MCLAHYFIRIFTLPPTSGWGDIVFCHGHPSVTKSCPFSNLKNIQYILTQKRTVHFIFMSAYSKLMQLFYSIILHQQHWSLSNFIHQTKIHSMVISANNNAVSTSTQITTCSFNVLKITTLNVKSFMCFLIAYHTQTIYKAIHIENIFWILVLKQAEFTWYLHETSYNY